MGESEKGALFLNNNSIPPTWLGGRYLGVVAFSSDTKEDSHMGGASCSLLGTEGINFQPSGDHPDAFGALGEALGQWPWVSKKNSALFSRRFGPRAKRSASIGRRFQGPTGSTSLKPFLGARTHVPLPYPQLLAPKDSLFKMQIWIVPATAPNHQLAYTFEVLHLSQASRVDSSGVKTTPQQTWLRPP